MWLPILAIALQASAGHASVAAADDAALRRMQMQDARVADIALRLSLANRELCPRLRPRLGLSLHSTLQYSPRLRGAVERVFGLKGGVGVMAVAAGSPSQAAGLRPGDVLMSVDGTRLPPRLAAPAAPASNSQVEAAATALGQRLAPSITVHRQGALLSLSPVAVEGCAYEMQMVPSSRINASADGRQVFVTSAMVEFASDDDLALVLGHELAHNILGHQEGLRRARPGGSLPAAPRPGRAQLRRMEADADYLGHYLAARAGYSLEGEPAFWPRLRRRRLTDGFWSHGGASARAERGSATRAEIAAKIVAGHPLTPAIKPADR